MEQDTTTSTPQLISPTIEQPKIKDVRFVIRMPKIYTDGLENLKSNARLQSILGEKISRNALIKRAVQELVTKYSQSNQVKGGNISTNP
ncbi:MAG TPA: hypothetical protein VHA12_00155 [Candidatus Nanoarchaeia archaeon]|nr:hypothetical protein [Candidatus Nanoarchaeia archaeon]